MNKHLIPFFVLLMLGTQAFALDKKQEAAIHREKALKWVEAKDWESARKEADKAADLDPDTADNWLILGTVEQRLEHKTEAVEAFRKYLSMNPPEEKAKEVRQRIADLEVAKESQAKTEDAEAGQKAVDMSSPGFGFWYSPKHTVAGGDDDLKSEITTSFGTGLTSPNFTAGFRYASGTIPAAMLRRKGQPDTIVTNLSHKIYELEFAYTPIVINPYTSLGPVSIGIPIYFGMPLFNVEGGGASVTGMGYEAATGVSARWHTRAGIVPEFIALYHIGSVQLMSLHTDKDENFRLVSGAEAPNSFRGFEFRIALNFWLWGKTDAERAAEAAERRELQKKLDDVKTP